MRLNLTANFDPFRTASLPTSAVEVGHEMRGDGQVDLAFSVIDTGIGISPGVASRLFQRFGPDEVSSEPGKAGWTAESYRLHQRRALEEGRAPVVGR